VQYVIEKGRGKVKAAWGMERKSGPRFAMPRSVIRGGSPRGKPKTAGKKQWGKRKGEKKRKGGRWQTRTGANHIEPIFPIKKKSIYWQSVVFCKLRRKTKKLEGEKRGIKRNQAVYPKNLLPSMEVVGSPLEGKNSRWKENLVKISKRKEEERKEVRNGEVWGQKRSRK